MYNSTQKNKILRKTFNQRSARITLKTTKRCWKKLKKIEISVKICHVHGSEENIVKMALYPKLNCGFSIIPIQTPTDFFPKIGKLILKSVCQFKGPRIAKMIFFKKKKVYLFILRDSEHTHPCRRANMSECEWGKVWAGEGQREKEREHPKQAPCCQCRLQHGVPSHKPWGHDLSWNQEPAT